MRNTLISLLLAGSFLLTLAASGSARPSDPTSGPKALFHNNDRVCLVGDSITHSGPYHSYVFLYYATRFPGLRLTFMNCGISGDSASGMRQRLDWDVYAKNPTVVALSAGMNDVNRSLYSQTKPPENAAEKQNDAIEKFKENIRQLTSSFREHGLRTIFITPTLYDEDLDSLTENLRGVNAALGTCSDFILDFAKSQNAVAVDFWHPMNELSRKGKQTDAAFTLTRKDRVHPESVGHLIMAYLFLDQTGAPRDVWRLSIDAEKVQILAQSNCEASGLIHDGNRFEFSNKEFALPFPVIEEAKEAYRLVPITERLNQQMLQISGLAGGRYTLTINGSDVGKYSEAQLQHGINLADNPRTPQNAIGGKLALLCSEHHSLGSKLRTLRRVEIKHLAKVDLSDRAAVEVSLRQFIAEKEAQKHDPEANSGYYIKTARTYLEEIGNEAAMKERMKELEDEIYRLNQPQTYAYAVLKEQEPETQQ